MERFRSHCSHVGHGAANRTPIPLSKSNFGRSKTATPFTEGITPLVVTPNVLPAGFESTTEPFATPPLAWHRSALCVFPKLIVRACICCDPSGGRGVAITNEIRGLSNDL